MDQFFSLKFPVRGHEKGPDLLGAGCQVPIGDAPVDWSIDRIGGRSNRRRREPFKFDRMLQLAGWNDIGDRSTAIRAVHELS